MVPATVNFSILVKIDEVDQQLVTGEADKTGRVPTHSRARAGGKHCNFTSIYLQPTLLAHGMHHCSGQKLDRASSKGFFLPLGTEHLQFFLLLFAQRLAVPHLQRQANRRTTLEHTVSLATSSFPEFEFQERASLTALSRESPI